MTEALDIAALIREGADPITGKALPGLVRQFNVADASMMRLAHVINRAALTAIMTGVTLDLSTAETTEASANARRPSTTPSWRCVRVN